MTPEEHRKIAITCFNAIWKILGMESTSISDELEAIRLAQTSTWHWYQCGEPVNFQRGEWICSRVYVHFGHIEEALYHANLCRELTEKYDLKDFDLSYSYEAFARIYKKSKNEELYKHYLELLIKSLDQVKDLEDRKVVEMDIESLKN